MEFTKGEIDYILKDIKKRPKFVPKNKLKCLKCGDEIMSSYSGEFASCSCGAIYIDETEHYWRVGGNEEDFKMYSRENTDSEWIERSAT